MKRKAENMENGESSYRRYLDGDESAFAEVQRAYFDRLTFFSDRYVRDVHAAEDIAIDTLLELIVHKHRYNFGSPLSSYLFTIAKNKSLNYLRHRDRFTVTPIDEEEREADRASLEEDVLKRDALARVSRAVDALPEEQRALVHLVYFEGMTYGSAAKVLGMGKKKADNLLYRARAALKKTLEEETDIL